MRQPVKILLVVIAGIVGLFKRALSSDAAPPPAETNTLGKKRRIWRFARVAIVLLIGAGVLGFLVVVSGVVPIKASSGHWAVTRWFLDFAKRRSVSTHSLSIEAPPLSDPMLVQKGAGAYENNCRVCHGSPLLPNPAVPQSMLPKPPYLKHITSKWDTEELFYIVKHGLKFTGMPAWPAPQRDDEVWAIVAFLQQFSNLDQNGYRSLVETKAAIEPGEAFDQVLRLCESCHGPQGLGRGLGDAPRLAGQKLDYLYASLSAYASRQRFSGIMQPIAERLDEGERRRLANYYANLAQHAGTQTIPESLAAVNRGEQIATQGIPAQRVPACNSCHEVEGPRNPIYPELAGQYAGYLVLQLKLFQRAARGGTPYAHLMHHVAPYLTEEQMRDVALYFESQPPRP